MYLPRELSSGCTRMHVLTTGATFAARLYRNLLILSKMRISNMFGNFFHSWISTEFTNAAYQRISKIWLSVMVAFIAIVFEVKRPFQ